jgi:hypothetical protein
MKGDQMGIRAASPTPLELPLSNQTWFSFRPQTTAFALGLRVWRKLSDRLMSVVSGFCSTRSTKIVSEGLASTQSGRGKVWRFASLPRH